MNVSMFDWAHVTIDGVNELLDCLFDERVASLWFDLSENKYFLFIEF